MKIIISTVLSFLFFGGTTVYANDTSTSPGALMLNNEASNVVTRPPGSSVIPGGRLPDTGEVASFLLSLIGVLLIFYVLRKKKHLFKGFFVLVLLLPFTLGSISTLAQSAGSGAFVRFLPMPIIPEPDPDEEGELSIVRTPYFYFDVPMYDDEGFVSFYGKAEKRIEKIGIKNEGTQLSDETAIANYVLIQDLRSGAHDWNLTVRKEDHFTNVETGIDTQIIGAQIILSDIWIAAMQQGQDARVEEHHIPGSVTIVQGQEAFVARGSSDEGDHFWAVVFGFCDESANSDMTHVEASGTLITHGTTFTRSIKNHWAVEEVLDDLYFDNHDYEMKYNTAVRLRIPLGQVADLGAGVFTTHFTWILSETP
ncbi:MAG: WxL domain-containing protein [Streptococcaceae bacterium]|jgi:LPXTG-motif cell wall-anchored protein|nr:WxL domain-containing protein [Streptococcaceae bacterium]